MYPLDMATNGTTASFQIGELAKRSELSVDAIRFYERRKLLPAPIRTAGRFRLYTENDLERPAFHPTDANARLFSKRNYPVGTTSNG